MNRAGMQKSANRSQYSAITQPVVAKHRLTLLLLTDRILPVAVASRIDSQTDDRFRGISPVIRGLRPVRAIAK